MSPESEDVNSRLLFDRSSEDVYSDPGSPMLRRTPAGTYVIAKVKKENDEGTYILLNGNSATPSGNIPFLDLFDMRLSWWWRRRQRAVTKEPIPVTQVLETAVVIQETPQSRMVYVTGISLRLLFLEMINPDWSSCFCFSELVSVSAEFAISVSVEIVVWNCSLFLLSLLFLFLLRL
ncbi:hypothetical protein Vadar_020610 [Vaccinium darrowii]|uniref:Uncharacterized protein n=1 Tax=Vaccinium darrowii TaxID=229202 RepID=A0ACB7YX35_9ERIC|nr:hypothetical protein Vadar_020610 [Vaccinium darrowii]